jgi:ketosteroid isomerase-like protein
VRGAAPVPEPDLARQREVVDAFLAAARAGDFDALVAVLDPDVVFRADGRGALPPVQGAEEVAQRVLTRGTPFAPYGRPALVNGAAGAYVEIGGVVRAVAGFTVVDGRIVEIDLMLDPEKLRRVAVER